MSNSSHVIYEKYPLISVIIPVYNGERFLAEAIQNLQSQNYQPIEIIIVDDGSTDRTSEIATQFQPGIRYVYQANQGPSAARNSGIKIAQGEIFTFLDVDDLWAENVLLDFTNYLIAHPQVEIVQGLIQQMQIEPINTEENLYLSKPNFQPYQFINLGSALYRRSVFDKVGLFDPELRDNEDTDWFMRAWEQNIIKDVIPSVMLFYRKHDRNMTHQQSNLVHYGLLKIYKRHIDRIRSQATPASPSISWYAYLGQQPQS